MLPRPGSQELICDLDWNWGQIKISGIRSSELLPGFHFVEILAPAKALTATITIRIIQHFGAALLAL